MATPTPQSSAERSVVVYQPVNEVEARGLELALRDAGISAVTVVHQDTAYPGITDRHRSWGELRVAAQDVKRAEEAILYWLSCPPEDLDAAAQAAAMDEATVQQGSDWFQVPALAFLLSLALPGMGQLYNGRALRGAIMFAIAAVVHWSTDSTLLALLIHLIAGADAGTVALRARSAAEARE